MITITSSANKKFKYIRSLMDKKQRRLCGEYTVEGAKSVRDAIASDKEISLIAVSDKFYSEASFSYPEGTPVYTVNGGIFDKLCETKTPQGIIAVIKIEDDNNFAPDTEKAYIYCDGISDPGNLGTIIRTADAAGFGGVILSPGCADLYSPKTVRSSMGSFFNIPLIRSKTAEDLAAYKEAGFEIYGGALSDDSVSYKEADMTAPTIIVIGNEANGISEQVLRLCKKIRIPINGKAESLNAAIAAAILMYELVSQRS